MSDRLLSVFWHQFFELGLGILMLEVGLSGTPNTPENSTRAFDELMSTIRTASMRARGGVGAEEARDLVTFHASPKLLFRRQKEMLIERIS
jgi:hypothetical protein